MFKRLFIISFLASTVTTLCQTRSPLDLIGKPVRVAENYAINNNYLYSFSQYSTGDNFLTIYLSMNSKLDCIYTDTNKIDVIVNSLSQLSSDDVSVTVALLQDVLSNYGFHKNSDISYFNPNTGVICSFNIHADQSRDGLYGIGVMYSIK